MILDHAEECRGVLLSQRVGSRIMLPSPGPEGSQRDPIDERREFRTAAVRLGVEFGVERIGGEFRRSTAGL